MRTLAICLLLAVLVGCESPEARCQKAHDRYLATVQAREDSLWGMTGESSSLCGDIPTAMLGGLVIRVGADNASDVQFVFYDNGLITGDFTFLPGQTYYTWDVPTGVYYLKQVPTDLVEWSTNCPYTTSWGEYKSRD